MKERVQSVKLLSNTPQPNRTVFVLGSTGCGKTTVAANLLLQESRFVIFDTRGEFSAAGIHNAVVCCTVSTFVQALNDGTERVIFNAAKYARELSVALNAVLVHLFDFQEANKHLGSVTFALDELNKFVHVNTRPPEALKDAIERGRGFGVEKLFCAQWFNTIPTWARDSFSELYVFQHTEKQGLAMLESYGFNAEEIRTLPQHVALYRSRSGVIEQIRFVPEVAHVQRKEEETLCRN